MQNLKVKMLSVAIAALTAATPILSSYVAYASDITVNDDGTVTQISTSTDEKTDETKFLFVNLKTVGGKVVINEGEDSEQTVRLEKQMDRLHIDVYDKDNVMISSENAIDNGYTYVYEAKADDAVNVKAYADDGYVVKLYELTDDSSGTEIAEDVGFDAGNKVEAFKYPVFMEYDKTVKIGFEKKESAEDIAKDLSVNDETDEAGKEVNAKAEEAAGNKEEIKVEADVDKPEDSEAEDVKADEEAATKVLPSSSFITCAYICLLLLNTLKRGRSAVPEILLRTRYFIFCRLSIFVTIILLCYDYYLAPAAFPDLRRICSPKNKIPFPL